MGKKKKPNNKASSKKYSKYSIEGDKVARKKTCPKCGPGIFLADHKTRLHCGKCGYVEMNSKNA